MALRLRITHGLNEGATFGLGSRFVRVGSDPGNEIRLSGTGIPKIALVLEQNAATGGYRIHDRSHGRLSLDGKPISQGASTPWEPSKELSVDGIVSLVLEDDNSISPPEPLRPGPTEERTKPKPPYEPESKADESPRKKTPSQSSAGLDARTEPSLRLTAKASSKNKFLEIVQIVGILLATGGICWGILYIGSPPPAVEKQKRIQFDSLADDLWAATRQRNHPLPARYMEILTQGRVGEDRDPRLTLDLYTEMKQDILSRRKNGSKNINVDLENRLLEYLNQRIPVLQRKLSQKKKK